MAQQALGPGTAVPRRRALFGLLDAEGWGWASVKAFVWLVIIIFLLGYLPDRAYYLTVGRTVDLGVLVWSPINLCPPQNESLPCPAPVGALVPWEPSPPELNLPQPRIDGSTLQVGTQIFYIGGSDGTTAQSTVYVAETVGAGNFDKWTEGPALPEPRADASVVYVAGSIYVIGGRDASGAPTTTAFVLSPDSQTGALGEWDDSRLSGPARTAQRRLGGDHARRPPAHRWPRRDRPRHDHVQDVAQLDRRAWRVGEGAGRSTSRRPTRRPSSSATTCGCTAATTPTVRPARSSAVPSAWRPPRVCPRTRTRASSSAGTSTTRRTCRSRRTNASGWGANGAIYIAGGSDGTTPKREVYWAVPTTEGDLPEWKHLDVSDLPETGLEGAPAVVSGPEVILVGGKTAPDTILASSVRANTAPLSPFFQLGLVGATVPGLKIEGEIGQQLGYLNAATVGAINFILLILVGIAFAHKAQTRALIGRVFHRVQ